MISGTRGFGAYTFFAIFCGLSAVWTYFLVPETKGRSLEDMDRVFGDNAASEDLQRREDLLRTLKERDESNVAQTGEKV